MLRILATAALLACALDIPTPLRSSEQEERLAVLVGDLRRDDADARAIAAWELARLGRAARPAEPDLVRALRDPESRVRANAADAILRIGGDARLVLPLLDDRNSAVRLSAAQALIAVHGDVESAALALFELHNRRGFNRETSENPNDVLHSLTPALSRRMQVAVVDLVAKKRIPDSFLYTLSELGPLEPSLVRPLMKVIQENRAARVDAITALLRIGSDASEAVPVLQEMAQDHDPLVALPAYAALVAIAPDQQDHLENLLSKLSDGSPKIRIRALELIEELGARGAGAAPALAKAMTDAPRQQPNNSFRRRCSTTLHRLGKPAAIELAKVLNWELDDESRAAVLQTMRMLGPVAADATPALITLLSGPEIEESTQVEAIDALAAIGPAARTAAPILLTSLKSDASRVRAAAARALGKTGPHGNGVGNALRTVLSDPDPEVRLSAGIALLALGAQPDAVFLVLVELIDESNPDVCWQTIKALQDLGAGASPAMARLKTALGFEGGVSFGFGGILLCEAAGDCLGAIGAPAVPHLTAALQEDSPQIRARAAEGLQRIGSAAKSAVPGLIAVLGDDRKVAFQVGCMGFDCSVGECAIMALGQIGPDAATALPDLVKLLEREEALDGDLDQERVTLLVTSLGGVGRLARTVVPKLTRLLSRNDLELRTRTTVVAALARIDPESPDVVPGLRSFFAEVQGSDPADSMYMSEFATATQAIVQMGRYARPLLHDLIAIFEQAHLLNYRYRCGAAYAVARIDPDNEAALNYLKWAARHGDWLMHVTATRKLDELQSPADSSK